MKMSDWSRWDPKGCNDTLSNNDNYVWHSNVMDKVQSRFLELFISLENCACSRYNEYLLFVRIATTTRLLLQLHGKLLRHPPWTDAHNYCRGTSGKRKSFLKHPFTYWNQYHHKLAYVWSDTLTCLFVFLTLCWKLFVWVIMATL